VYNGPKVLDLSEKLTDRCIKEVIMDFDNMSPEEKLILLEEYCEKYHEIINWEDIQKTKEME
jgi:hypothetical protein